MHFNFTFFLGHFSSLPTLTCHSLKMTLNVRVHIRKREKNYLPSTLRPLETNFLCSEAENRPIFLQKKNSKFSKTKIAERGPMTLKSVFLDCSVNYE